MSGNDTANLSNTPALLYALGARQEARAEREGELPSFPSIEPLFVFFMVVAFSPWLFVALPSLDLT
ncbi:MAG: hypothetical protein AABP62_27330 [Planctomycetota bacterium]